MILLKKFADICRTKSHTMYTQSQIESARKAYNNMLVIKSISDFNPSIIGHSEAHSRCENHNNIVNAIMNGDKELERKWKLFFLNQAVMSDNKNDAKKAKLSANKSASSDVLAAVKQAGRNLKDFYAFVKANKEIRNQFYTKNFSPRAVQMFLAQ